MAQQMTVVRLADMEPLIEALKFYASESSWEKKGARRRSSAGQDGGLKAREALGTRPQARVIEVEAWNVI